MSDLMVVPLRHAIELLAMRIQLAFTGENQAPGSTKVCSRRIVIPVIITAAIESSLAVGSLKKRPKDRSHGPRTGA